jgi:hypothetical protein
MNNPCVTVSKMHLMPNGYNKKNNRIKLNQL